MVLKKKPFGGRSNEGTRKLDGGVSRGPKTGTDLEEKCSTPETEFGKNAWATINLSRTIGVQFRPGG